MTDKNPADAVREALPIERFALTTLGYEYGEYAVTEIMPDSEGDYVAYDDHARIVAALTARVEELELKVTEEKRTSDALNGRLAALAGASPVGTLNVQRWRGIDAMTNFDFDYYGSLPDGSYPLFTHAPAKAREDELLALLRDMWHELVGAEAATGQAPLDTIKQRYDAALATFAEGAE